MADEIEKTVIEGEGGNAAPEPKKGSKSKLLLFGGIGLGAVVIGAALAVFVLKPMMSDSADSTEGDEIAQVDDDHNSEDSGDQGGHGESGKDASHGAKGKGQSLIYPIDNIVVNPAGTGGSRFLSVSFAFELESPQIARAFETKEVIIRDALITILSAKTVLQLTDPKQKEIVRYHIKKRVSQLMSSDQVAGVYYTDFVLQ